MGNKAIGACCVAGPECRAPAAYQVGGGIRYRKEQLLDVCIGCGETVCHLCSSEIEFLGEKYRLCNDCEAERET